MAAKKKAAKAGKASKVAKNVQPDGTKQVHIMADGTKVNGTWREGRLCCPTCARKLPVGPNTIERLERRRARQEVLKERAQEQFRIMADMIKKNAKGLGQDVPSDIEIAKMMAEAAG